MSRSPFPDRRRRRALLLLALLLHLLGAAFAPAVHAGLGDGGPVRTQSATLDDHTGAHDELACAVCLALHTPILTVAPVPPAAAREVSALAPAAPQRPPSPSNPLALRARAPPLA
jgi:hypothetical protein